MAIFSSVRTFTEPSQNGASLFNFYQAMKAKVYEEVRQALLQPEPDALVKAQLLFPQVKFDTLVAIRSQEDMRNLRLNHHKFRSSQRTQEYLTRYISGEDVLSISKAFEIPPCLLMRILLEQLISPNKQHVSLLLRDPLLVLEPSTRERSSDHEGTVPKSRLYDDICRCVENDNVCSPYVETIRRAAGLEYEILLREKLQELDIPFKSEDALRQAGFSKTPDIKLEVPIGVQGHVVNWIDSKASFGDEFVHKVQGGEQFQSYVNRFGPGMVIYWFGYVEDISDHPEILLQDSFPSKDDIYCLPRLQVQRKL